MESKIPTLKDIARQLKVSTSTVSRSLNNHANIGLETRRKVHELARKLQYEPNQSALFLKRGKSLTIGVILPELSESFFSSAISGIEDAALKANYTILIGQSHDSIEREKKLLETMRSHRVDGLLVSIAAETNCYEHFDSLQRYNIPVVFFDRVPKLQNIHSVTCDIASGTVEAIKYLCKKGHRIIGLINGPENLPASKERVEGYIRAMVKSRLKYDPSLVHYCSLKKEGVVAALDTMLAGKRKPTAIAMFNDYVAMHASEHLRNSKRRGDKDISIVSYANLPFRNHIAFPPLASVEQSPYLQGQQAAEILFELLDGKPGNYVTKDTCYCKIILKSKLVLQEQMK